MRKVSLLVTLLSAASLANAQEKAATSMGNMDLWLGWGVLVLLLIAANAVYIAAETAVNALRSTHVRHVREEQANRGQRLQDLIENKQRYVTAVLLASRLVRLGLFIAVLFIAQYMAVDKVDPSPAFAAVVPLVLFIGLPVLFLNLIVGELIPRSFAALHPHRVGIALYAWIRGAAILLSFPATLLVGLANVFTARFGGKAAFDGSSFAEEEIKNLVESAEETGEIESDERELIHSVLEFNDTVAHEIMTPRVDLDAMPVKSSPSDVIKVIRETGHSRIPLYEETDDQIVGIIHAKDLLLAMDEGIAVSLRKLMRPALFVPEGKSLHELLQEMRISRSQMAILQDEFGGTAGIITTEDIVEQLVGEIVDEYDEEEISLLETEHGWLVSGKTPIDDVNDALDSEFENEEFDTIGGLVFGQIGRQPRVGEKVDIDGFEFNVEETDGRRILRLLIRPCSQADAEVTASEE